MLRSPSENPASGVASATRLCDELLHNRVADATPLAIHTSLTSASRLMATTSSRNTITFLRFRLIPVRSLAAT